jgi:hypothetical protein
VKLKPSLCALLAAGLFSACTYEHREGNDRLSPNVTASLRRGVTTKEQVRALLGAPQSTKTQVPVIQPAGADPLPAKLTASEIWAYWKSSDLKPLVALPIISAKPRHTSYTVIIFFDSTGMVLDCEIEDMHT